MTEKDQQRLKKVAARLVKLREERGLSQRALSARCGIDFGKISRVENAKANLVVTTLIELAQGLGVHPKELLDTDFDQPS